MGASREVQLQTITLIVNDYGVVSVPLLRNWCERYSSLQRLVWNLTDLFGIDPHVRSEPKVSSHLRYFQEEEEDTHESDNANAHVHACPESRRIDIHICT